jgi:hypothetical protein
VVVVSMVLPWWQQQQQQADHSLLARWSHRIKHPQSTPHVLALTVQLHCQQQPQQLSHTQQRHQLLLLLLPLLIFPAPQHQFQLLWQMQQ